MKRLIMWMAMALLSLVAGVAGAADVQLGAGDMLRISVYGSPDLSLETRVSENGEITFPLVGTVPVGGLQVAAAEKKLSGLLESGGFVRKAQVNIIVTSLQSQQVAVLGMINRPGRYPIEGKRSLIDMLAMAGGISVDGSDSVNVIRKRNGTTTKEVVDITEMIRSGNLQRDFELAGGDVVFVERAPRFYIYGEVQRPGTFRLEHAMTVQQALSIGGGLTARGTERGIRIKRRNAAGQLELLDAKHDDLVQIDDVVYVKESLF